MTTTDPRRVAHAAAGPSSAPAAATWIRPDALVLDADVVLHATPRAGGLAVLTTAVGAVLDRAGHPVDPAELEHVVRDGVHALEQWEAAADHAPAPLALAPRDTVELLVAPLPATARAALVAAADDLLADAVRALHVHTLDPHVDALLATARRLGVRVGVVAGTRSGRAVRALLDEGSPSGHRRFAVQVCADETGLRPGNPAMLALAAQALGAVPRRTWYVGGSVSLSGRAGRGARVGAVLLADAATARSGGTRDADLTVACLDAVAEALERASPPARGRTPVTRAQQSARSAPLRVAHPPSAVVLDHVGVTVTTAPDPDAHVRRAQAVARRLGAVGVDVEGEAVARAVARATEAAGAAPYDGAVTPVVFWSGLVVDELEPCLTVEARATARAWLRAEAVALTAERESTVQRAELRPGVRAVLQHAREARVPVAVVSGTLGASALRAQLATLGVEHLVATVACARELGRRKPDPAVVVEVLEALGADPATAWFVGDEPGRDVPAARAAGVGNVVLVRGGATADLALGAARGAHAPDHVLTEVSELIDLWPRR